MKTTSILSFVALSALATARPLSKTKLLRREVPQEHSHEQFVTTVRNSLILDNPAGISDPVFGLLGNQAGAGGKGQIADVECLQQATADQAFTNAKAANDVPGMVAALMYRALERNTPGPVGRASNPCTSIKATNPEIAAIQQHQDPASPGAAGINKAVTLELAKQIKAVGGDPLEALKSGTFQPGDVTDATGKGNTCDTFDDPVGCIFTQKLIVEDVTADEITAAVGGAGAANGAASNANSAAGAGANMGANMVAAPAAPAAAPAAPAAAPAAGMGANMAAAAAAPAVAPAAAPAVAPAAAPAAAPAVGMGANMAAAPAAGNAVDVVNMGNNLVVDKVAAPAAQQGAPQVLASPDQQSSCGAAQNNAAPGMQNGAAATGQTGGAAAAPAGLDFGSCPNAGIVFGPGFDGRKEDSFQPADKTQFTQGSALNIDIITKFMCDRFGDSCGASDAAKAACITATAATKGKTGQAAATAWNEALGLTNVPNLTGA